jgi:hypothetical protein
MISLHVPVHYVGILAFAAFFAVCAVTHYIEIPMKTRRYIHIHIPPRIERDFFLFEITAFPVFVRNPPRRRLCDQRIETLLGVGIEAIVQFEQLQPGLEVPYLHFGISDSGIVGSANNLWRDNCHKETQDENDDDHLQERKAFFPSFNHIKGIAGFLDVHAASGIYVKILALSYGLSAALHNGTAEKLASCRRVPFFQLFHSITYNRNKYSKSEVGRDEENS